MHTKNWYFKPYNVQHLHNHTT